MKKTLTIIASLLFMTSSVFADSFNVGISIGQATLAASGTETQNSGAKITKSEREGSAILPSIFIERQFDLPKDGLSITLGVDYIPVTGNIATLADGSGAASGLDAKVEAGKLATLYIQPKFAFNDRVSLYARAGVSQGDLEISELTRQATTAGTASTDKAQTKDLKGTVIGLGVEIAMENNFFARLDASRTDFDTINHTNSNSKKLTADAELDRINFVFGRSF